MIKQQTLRALFWSTLSVFVTLVHFNDKTKSPISCDLLDPALNTDQNKIVVPPQGPDSPLIDEFCDYRGHIPALAQGPIKPEYKADRTLIDTVGSTIHKQIRNFPPRGKHQQKYCYHSTEGELVIAIGDYEFNHCDLNLPDRDLEAAGLAWTTSAATPISIVIYNTRYNYLKRKQVVGTEGYIHYVLSHLDTLPAKMLPGIFDNLRENLLPNSPLNLELTERLNDL